MGFIKDLFNRAKERKEKSREIEENQRAFSNVEQKKLSHNERVLLKLLEEERQKYIKDALRYEDKRRQFEEKKKARDMLKFDGSLFKNDNILSEKRRFLFGGDSNDW